MEENRETLGEYPPEKSSEVVLRGTYSSDHDDGVTDSVDRQLVGRGSSLSALGSDSGNKEGDREYRA